MAELCRRLFVSRRFYWYVKGVGRFGHGDRDGGVKGSEKVYHCGGGIVYHRQDEKGLNWEPGVVRSRSPQFGVSQESSGSSETWDAAFCRLCRRR